MISMGWGGMGDLIESDESGDRVDLGDEVCGVGLGPSS